MASRFRKAWASSALSLLLSSCGLAGYPTQAHPSCSWANQPPRDADTLCDTAFHTLQTIVTAQVRGDTQTIRRLVMSQATAARIVSYGSTLRAERVRGLHVRPSLTLDVLAPGSLGASFYLIGRTQNGKLSTGETVYLQVRHGLAVVTHDVPGQEW